MTRHNTTAFLAAAICAAIAFAFSVGPVAGLAASLDGNAPTRTLPGDAPVPFWPHETGALLGTSETFVDMRANGSYYDPSVGRRVAGGANHVGAPNIVRAQPFNWGDFALGVGAALGFLLPLGGLVGAALVSRKRRGTSGATA